jgi:NAD(P)-dependent dehydrogenase (short-subunit alcohol dehydrogenase family)
LASSLTEQGSKAISIESEPANAGAAASSVESPAAALGGLDGLVISAGIIYFTPFLEIGLDHWRRLFHVNLDAAFFILQATGSSILSAPGGAIVSISSIAGRSGRHHLAHYAASKAALLSLTNAPALALAPTVSLNAACPSVIPTQMWN